MLRWVCSKHWSSCFLAVYTHQQSVLLYRALSAPCCDSVKRRLSVTNLSSENNLPSFQLNVPVVIRVKVIAAFVCTSFTFTLMMTGAFTWNVSKLFSNLKLVTDNLLFIYVAANWEATKICDSNCNHWGWKLKLITLPISPLCGALSVLLLTLSIFLSHVCQHNTNSTVITCVPWAFLLCTGPICSSPAITNCQWWRIHIQQARRGEDERHWKVCYYLHVHLFQCTCRDVQAILDPRLSFASYKDWTIQVGSMRELVLHVEMC